MSNPVSSSPIQAAIEAFKSGKDVSQAVYGDANAVKPSAIMQGESDASSSSEDTSSGTVESTGTTDTGSPDRSKEPLETEGTVSESSAPDVEELVITDEKGKRKIKIDWKNRESLKKAVSLAAGARKWQQEKDQAEKKLREYEAKLKEVDAASEERQAFKKLNEVWKNEGLKGLVNLLEGKQEAYDAFVQKELERRQAYDKASPAEKRIMELEQKMEQEARERLRAQKEAEELRNASQSELANARKERLASVMNPIFDKYRFEGTIGDPETEAALSQTVWDRAKKALMDLPDNVELTASVIDREFAKAASVFSKAIQKKSTDNVKKILDNKKAAAAENVATKAVQGFKPNPDKEKFRQDIRSGNLTAALTSILTGKTKL